MNIVLSVARSCGLKTLTAAAIIGLSLVTFAEIVNEWQSLKFFASFGGLYWGSVTSCCAAMFIFTWSACVFYHLNEMIKSELGEAVKWFKYLIGIMVLTSFVWFVGYCSLLDIYGKVEDWDIFNIVAMLFVSLPIPAACMGMVGLFMYGK
ncbi:hypothetical protein Q5N60_16875 [Vibrio cholerae]|uniref:hypothetical protein n=1 Tax=Vibrio cholerae TaxID=666 RepID=UPI00293430C8|nr:hypothetical protein [Vibrio cholerae]MDV2387337.1 hypothetical protein [Vibrio cholerae]